MKKSQALTVSGKVHIIMVYCGGHGATKSEKQLYLLNTSEAKQATFPLEYKMRYIVNNEISLGRVFSIYDCCRVPIEAMSGLDFDKRGYGDQPDESDNQDDNDPIKYIHMQACGPGGVADADGGFAERLHNHAIKYANKDPIGYLNFPNDWMRMNLNQG